MHYIKLETCLNQSCFRKRDSGMATKLIPTFIDHLENPTKLRQRERESDTSFICFKLNPGCNLNRKNETFSEMQKS